MHPFDRIEKSGARRKACLNCKVLECEVAQAARFHLVFHVAQAIAVYKVGKAHAADLVDGSRNKVRGLVNSICNEFDFEPWLAVGLGFVHIVFELVQDDGVLGQIYAVGICQDTVVGGFRSSRGFDVEQSACCHETFDRQRACKAGLRIAVHEK